MGDKHHTAITISRQMGSGGTYIGYLLAKELGYKYIDREILRQASKHLKTETDWLAQYDERSSGLLSNLLRAFSLGTPEYTGVSTVRQPIYDRDLFTLECKIMNNIVDRHDAVIIGRGGFYALRNRPSVFRIFVHAPQEFRIKRLMKVKELTEAKAARLEIEESDIRKTRFIRDMVGVNWTDSLNYHLCIDSSMIDFSASVEMILNLVRGRRKEFSQNE
ncbi:MAG TPA: cytidylate kinase-like family protein [Syntrophales bacterium]|nr:cytidylate kinase-like family protein [Syntrophales bacterium]